MNQSAALMFFFIQLCFYAFILIFSILRFGRVIKMRPVNCYIILFYTSLVTLYFVRCIVFQLLYYKEFNESYSTQTELKIYTRYLLISFDAPKAFLYISLFVLFILNIQSNYEAHIDFLEPNISTPMTSKGAKILIISSLIFQLSMIGLYNTLFIYDIIGDKCFVIIMLSQSSISIFIFFSKEIYKSLKFSGYPFQDEELRMKCKYIKNIDLFWTLGRLIESTVCAFQLINNLAYDTTLNSLIDGDGFIGLLFYFGYAIDLLFSEFQAGVFIQDKSFIDLFNEKDFNHNKHNHIFESEISADDLFYDLNFLKANTERGLLAHEENHRSTNHDQTWTDEDPLNHLKEEEFQNMKDFGGKSNDDSRQELGNFFPNENRYY